MKLEPGMKVWYHGRLSELWGLWDVDHVSDETKIVYLKDPSGEHEPIATWMRDDCLTPNDAVLGMISLHDEYHSGGDNKSATLWREEIKQRTLIDIRDVPDRAPV